MKKRQILMFIVCLASILVIPMLFGCSGNTDGEKPIFGVLEGKASIGPRLPEEIGQPYPTEVYQPRKVMVYDADHKELLRQLDLDENGYYSVELPPGDYTIDINYYCTDTSNAVPRKLKIKSGLHCNLDIDFNTGVPVGNHTPIPVKDLGLLQVGQEAPDDIMPAPGMGPAYRANIHQQGVENPWPSIVVSQSVYYDANSMEEARVSYRKLVETLAGETRKNIIKAVIPGGEVKSLSLYADDIPQGFTLTDGMQWSGPSSRASVLVIEIAPDVAPGEYPLEIGLLINGKDYGTVTCTVKVAETS